MVIIFVIVNLEGRGGGLVMNRFMWLQKKKY